MPNDGLLSPMGEAGTLPALETLPDVFLIPLANSLSLGVCGRAGAFVVAIGAGPPFAVIDRDRMPGAGNADFPIDDIPDTRGFGSPGVGSCDMMVVAEVRESTCKVQILNMKSFTNVVVTVNT